MNFWVWILDGINVLDLQWLWDLIWPDTLEGKSQDNAWVAANTWPVDMVEVAVMKWEGTEKFNYKT